MPDLVITLTANQAQRLRTALGAENLAEATAAIKAMLKERVKQYEAQLSSNAAYDAQRAQVDMDFGGF